MLRGGREGEETQVRLWSPRRHDLKDFLLRVVVVTGFVLPFGLVEVRGCQHPPQVGGRLARLGTVGLVHDQGIVPLG